MSLAVQVVFTGLSAGGVYGLVAIGYSLLYRLTGKGSPPASRSRRRS